MAGWSSAGMPRTCFILPIKPGLGAACWVPHCAPNRTEIARTQAQLNGDRPPHAQLNGDRSPSRPTEPETGEIAPPHAHAQLNRRQITVHRSYYRTITGSPVSKIIDRHRHYRSILYPGRAPWRVESAVGAQPASSVHAACAQPRAWSNPHHRPPTGYRRRRFSFSCFEF